MERMINRNGTFNLTIRITGMRTKRHRNLILNISNIKNSDTRDLIKSCFRELFGIKNKGDSNILISKRQFAKSLYGGMYLHICDVPKERAYMLSSCLLYLDLEYKFLLEYIIN